MEKALKNNAFIRGLTNAAFLLFALNLPTGVHAADLYWSGTGTWDTTTQNWGTANGGPYDAATWSNASPDSAIFEGTAGTVTLGGAITAAGLTFAVDGYTVTGNTLTLSGSGPTAISSGTATISSALSGSLTKSGAGTLTLSNPTSFTGPMTIDAGVVNVASAAYAGVFTINSGAELRLSGGNNRIAPTVTGEWTVNGGTLAVADGTAHTVYGSGITLNNGTLASLAGGNAGIGSFFINKALTITANGASNQITGSNVLGINGFPLTMATPLSTDVLTVSGQMLMGGSVTKSGTGTLRLSATNTYTGGTTVEAGTLRLDGGGGQTGLIRGTLTIASGATVQSGGDGTTQWQLGFGNNAQAVSSIVINGGTLNFEAASSNSTGTAAATITMTGGAIGGSQAWEWYYGQTTTPTLETLAAATTATVDNLQLRLTGGGSATFNVAAGAVGGGLTPGVDLRVGTLRDKFEPGAAVIKTGSGVMQFSGDNTYIGPTSVDAGTLLINGDASAATGVVTVAAGATLGGAGTVGGATTISGTHSPGASPGLQTFTNGLSYASTGTLVWELSANTAQSADRGTLYDGIDLTTAGALSIDPAASMSLVFDQSLTDSTPSSVDWTNAFWDDDQQWTIIDVAAPVTWNGTVFGSLSVGADSLGALLSTVRPNASFSLADSGGDLVLQYVAVPEPGTLALAAAALAAAGLGLRRSGHSSPVGPRAGRMAGRATPPGAQGRVSPHGAADF